MPYIGRRDDLTIYACWTVPQWEGQEVLSEDHPDVVLFRTPPPPIDRSDLDKLQKEFKALALCVAQIGGLTVPQMKALFRQKWDLLP